MALVYDSRNRTLSVTAERTANEQRQRDAETAENRCKAEVEGLKVAELERLSTPRHLTAEQKTKLSAFLRASLKGKMTICQR
jgi:predicted protein tyrosine phosphatase